jgi:hypothetical protein
MNKTCAVRVGTEAFKRGDTYFYGRTIRVIKKKTEVDYLYDDCQQVGTQEAIENILNINTVKDGLYQLVFCNVSKDCETGYIDDFNFKLVPYEE